MQIILLEKIKHLGSFGEIINVKPGYARNYLIPKNKAILATLDNLKKFEHNKDIIKKQLSSKNKEAITRFNRIKKLNQIIIPALSRDKGKLFGSIKSNDIANAITKLGVKVYKNEIKLPKGYLKEIGEYEIDIKLYKDICAKIKVIVVSEKK